MSLLLVAACRSDSRFVADPPTFGSAPASSAVAAVSMRMSTAQLAVGETVQLGATPRTITGAATGAKAVLWRSNAPTVASVDQNALVTGVSPGMAYIIVNIDGHEGQTIVTVTPPGR